MESIKWKSIILAALFNFSGLTIVIAQDHHHDASAQHEHAAPHGGIVANAGNYHVEMLNVAYVCPMNCRGSESATSGNCPVCGMKLGAENKVRFYLLDGEENTLNVYKTTGKAVFQLEDGTQQVEELTVFSDEHLWAELPARSMHFLKAIVTINYEGQNVNASIKNIHKQEQELKKEPAGHGGHDHDH